MRIIAVEFSEQGGWVETYDLPNGEFTEEQYNDLEDVIHDLQQIFSWNQEERTSREEKFAEETY